MFDAAHVGEAQVNEFDVFGFEGFEDFVGGHEGLGRGVDGWKVQAACQSL
jgi:hypothetical protein